MIVESLKAVVDYLKEVAPFSALITTAVTPKPNKVLVQRVLEMVIVVVATGGVVYGVVTTKFEVFEKTIDEVKRDIRQIRRDLYMPRFKGNGHKHKSPTG